MYLTENYKLDVSHKKLILKFKETTLVGQHRVIHRMSAKVFNFQSNYSSGIFIQIFIRKLFGTEDKFIYRMAIATYRILAHRVNLSHLFA